MPSPNRRLRLPLIAFTLLAAAGFALTVRLLSAQAPPHTALQPSFDQYVKPFFQKNCMACHNSDVGTAGVRVDQLDAQLEDRQIPAWEAIRRRLIAGTMPPKGLPQPTLADRQHVVEWITSGLEVARLRPAPKNGLVRRLTISQYRNTLRELLLLDDDLTTGLPPDAVSKDGFLNNKDTLQLSPLLTEAYFEIAEAALNRCIVDPKSKPSIQNFRVDLGANINPAPLPEKLVLGAQSMLLENPDFVVTQLIPAKPFAFEPFLMRTKYRFIEGYRGNDTVRGWREYDSIYHAVFADMRGSVGYPKGEPYNVVPQGLLLRPAIPTDEIFGSDGTYGPKASFKISLRELPNAGNFRVTVTAAKYRDGLLLDRGAPAQASPGVVWHDPRDPGAVTIPQAGIYQVDVYGPEANLPAPDGSHLNDGLAGLWPRDAGAACRLDGKARVADSPLGQAVSLGGATDSFTVPRAALPTNDDVNVGEGDFTVAAWVHPNQLRRAGLVALGGADRAQGWYLEMPDNKGSLRLQTAGRNEGATGTVSSPEGALRPKAWQHVSAVVRRGRNETRLYVNGYLVAKGSLGSAQFDDPKADLLLGRSPGAQSFAGELADVRLYRRPLGEAELLALVQPGKVQLGKQFVERPPDTKQDLALTLGDRQFSGVLRQPAFLVVRLEAGILPLRARYTGARDLDRIVLTPLPSSDALARRFAVFEKRNPRVGVSLGLRRDCGSTLAPVGTPQAVTSETLSRFVFEGAIRNFPSPDVEMENVNYLAGVREIGVHSEYTDGRDIPRLLVRSVEFEGPYYETWPPPSHRNVFVEFDRKNDLAAYARRILHDFAGRAYRRPITPTEESALMAVYQKSSAAGSGFQESVRNALLVVLTSPQFLFLIESSNTPAPEPLDSYELASKLSYFLWNGPPDRKTLQLATAGTLRSQLDAEVARMIADPKFARFTREFTSQWLSLDKFQVLEPDRKQFPKLTRDTRAQLKQEPVEFLQYLTRHNLPVRNLIQSDFLMADEAVADYYGLGDKTESGFEFVAIPHGRPELGGVLAQAAIMAGLSDGRESNPVKRGAWLARKIIAEPPADPPPNVPALKEDTKGLTLRQRLEQHRNQPGCVQCHTKIDPWGVALEEFDAGGRLKQQKVDAASTLPDQTHVSGIHDLKRYLGEDRIDQVAFSFLKHLATYATGRTLTYNELAWLKQDALKLKPRGYRMQDMIRYVANSKIFLEK
jgi:hypothetical protein